MVLVAVVLVDGKSWIGADALERVALAVCSSILVFSRETSLLYMT